MIERLRRLPGWARSSLGIGAGVVASLGFAPLGQWVLLLLAVGALSALIVTSPRLRVSFAVGLCFGLGFMGVSLRWMSAIFVEAMLGLVVMEALFYAVLGMLIHAVATSRWWPVLAAAAWSLVEFGFSHVPFNGFPWMRLGYAVIDSPLAGWLPLVGVPGATFLVALAGQALARSVLGRTGRRPFLVSVAVTAAVVVVGVVTPRLLADQRDGTIEVGYVQGNIPGGGIYGLGEPRTTTRNHLAETLRLRDRVRAGEVAAPAFVVWPENGTDADPFLDAPTKELVDQARAALGVPLLVGSITDGPGANERQTASLWYDPRRGVTARYDKRNIVPFGEWVPYRDVLEPLFPVVAYVGAQSVAGTTPGVLDVTAGGGPLKVGTMVCYDVAFDGTVHDTVTAGGEVLLVQSSNAMYLGTDQVAQQFAITRARAAELHREILVVTTSGLSGLIEADGSVAFVLPEHQPASGVVAMPRRHTITPAVQVSGPLETLLCLGFVVALAWRLVAGSRRRSQP